VLDRHVRYRAEEAVGWVTLDRPKAMNALNEEVLADLFDVVRAVNDDPSVRVLVITGAGPHFCAGGDLSWEQELDETAAARLMRLNSHLSFELRHAPQPVLGAVRGWCLGGGNELQLHFDFTIASDTARFGWPETRWGLLPFFYTPQLLPLIVGERMAREMLLLGRSYTPGQALDVGLVNAVVPDAELEDEARRWAAELVNRSASALRLVKLALNGVGDMMRVAANHEAGIVSKAVIAPGYHDEVSGFFATDRQARRPVPAPARSRS
jgi:enoyl-CoA hydratase/carnithine racemase